MGCIKATAPGVRVEKQWCEGEHLVIVKESYGMPARRNIASVATQLYALTRKFGI